ncbi:MAG: hypothetical protein SVM80_13815 [Halobacteriota archaeon]|nr:hypothetical protein [Halobacteriota archaeon]
MPASEWEIEDAEDEDKEERDKVHRDAMGAIKRRVEIKRVS